MCRWTEAALPPCGGGGQPEPWVDVALQLVPREDVGTVQADRARVAEPLPQVFRSPEAVRPLLATAQALALRGVCLAGPQASPPRHDGSGSSKSTPHPGDRPWP